MFPSTVTIEYLNDLSKGSMVEHVGIEFTEVGKDYIVAKMPVDHRTHQPFGLLHGGASATLAETLGSVGATCTINPEEKLCVGVEINVNHIKSIREGFVIGTTKPIHVGSKTQVWEIRIESEDNTLVSVSRLTLAVIDRKK